MAKRIGLLSDTHGHIDEKMLGFLETVDEIWHAGDIGNIETIDALNKIKPVRAVHGNIDNSQIRLDCPEILIFEIEDIKIIMTHIGGYPKHYSHGIKALLEREKPKIFVSGHSHILKVIYDKDIECLHLNPGAAGTQGFHKIRTMLRFTIDKADIKELEIWEYKR